VRIFFARSIAIGLCAFVHSRHAAAQTSAGKIQNLVDGLRTRLTISQRVIVTIVPHNPLVVSVARVKDRNATFALSIEDGFLDDLRDDEISAVVAHELGHVWIFTHHPYLQTEEGANEIALHIVSRESLDKLYGKVWQRAGGPGELVYMPPLKH